MPLPRRPSGIETFRVEGAIDSDPVSAVWDGRWAVVSRVLADHVALAIAVDEAFADSGIPPSFEHQPDPGSPEAFMLAALTCCDDVHVAEFELRGHRRSVAPNTD
jgi:hypothetical protein